jgi:tyrosine-protein kinase Etk/Wzc
MAQDRSLELLDYILILLKYKISIIILFVSLLVGSYLLIYFFIDEEFESSALIIPTSDDSFAGVSSLMKEFKNLPLGLGGKGEIDATDLYTTIIYSRTSLENIVNEFNLIEEYEVKNIEAAVKALEKKIDTDVTREEAFRITVNASSPEKAAEMVNFLLSYLNETVVKLNVQKSKNNREFLGQRYVEIVERLSTAEDSLQKYQEESGMMEAKEQLKLVLGAYSELETGLLEKYLQMSLLEKTLPEGSPVVDNAKMEYKLFKDELDAIKRDGKNNSIFLAYSGLPHKAKTYLRHFRDVEIYQTILELVIPLYEQARFEEAKNIPVLQVIDYGSVPIKRVYPKRTLMALLITIFITSLYVFVVVSKELIGISDNPKMLKIRNQIKYLR